MHFNNLIDYELATEHRKCISPHEYDVYNIVHEFRRRVYDTIQYVSCSDDLMESIYNALRWNHGTVRSSVLYKSRDIKIVKYEPINNLHISNDMDVSDLRGVPIQRITTSYSRNSRINVTGLHKLKNVYELSISAYPDTYPPNLAILHTGYEEEYAFFNPPPLSVRRIEVIGGARMLRSWLKTSNVEYISPISSFIDYLPPTINEVDVGRYTENDFKSFKIQRIHSIHDMDDVDHLINLFNWEHVITIDIESRSALDVAKYIVTLYPWVLATSYDLEDDPDYGPGYDSDW